MTFVPGNSVSGNSAGDVLHHLAEPDAWAVASSSADGYAPAAFEREGFIHLSNAQQVGPTFGRYYADRTDLVLLTINPAHRTVVDYLKWEASTGGELFPHLYVYLPLDAVVEVVTGWTP
jgi:uncharacterized protein (DUF952 family)